MKLYQYPKCSTCRNAVKFLRAHTVEFQSIDITLQPPTVDELRTMLAAYGGEIGRLFNRSGVRYRELKLKDSLPTMSEAEALALLASDGKLIKRPFLVGTTGPSLVGFKADEWQAVV
ncbi:ArsC family transcriptional regulator [Arenicella chitinivorans]|uniref:ArsC family transcriptional regulator n=1 Tax=Arenicella chitinivorans TaxID=1329800 RepID=A0A918RIU6_9GAMM|nr:arsenate reductase family protein [Arenicella chitinivorans]GGZ98243.1 ArsC family transcriptional regulator [Arenicella chitinivorans]